MSAVVFKIHYATICGWRSGILLSRAITYYNDMCSES